MEQPKVLLEQISVWERAVAGVYCARQRIITLFRSRGQASSPITSPVSNRCWATTKHQKLWTLEYIQYIFIFYWATIKHSSQQNLSFNPEEELQNQNRVESPPATKMFSVDGTSSSSSSSGVLLRGISSIICSSVAPSPPSHILTARFIVDRVLLIDSTIYGFDQSIFGFIFAGMTASKRCERQFRHCLKENIF